MIALLAAAVMSAPPSVGDYFPLVPGTVWEYHEQGIIMRDTVAKPEPVAGGEAVPIVLEVQGKEDYRSYYRIDGNTVYLVAYDVKKPLGAPIPVLKVGDGHQKWEFVGQSMFYGEPVLLTMKCESAAKGKRKVLGQDVDVIEVKSNSMLGSNPGTAIKVKQVAYYAKGIGLVEMSSDNTVGSQKSKSQLQLVKFEPPK